MALLFTVASTSPSTTSTSQSEISTPFNLIFGPTQSLLPGVSGPIAAACWGSMSLRGASDDDGIKLLGVATLSRSTGAGVGALDPMGRLPVEGSCCVSVGAESAAEACCGLTSGFSGSLKLLDVF